MDSLTCPTCLRTVSAASTFCHHCGTQLASADQETVRTMPEDREAPPMGRDAIVAALRDATQGRYEIEATLGQGGMGAVFRAQDLVLHKSVAIKVMLPGVGLDEQTIERFRQEARTIAGLRHPHIVTVHDLREHRGLHFFVLDYIPGRSLDRIVEQAGTLLVPIVRLWLSEVASALEFAHQRGVVHRDIKPGNILIDTDGNAVLTDFGIAKLQDNVKWKTMTGGFLGTPAYASPEQWRGQPVTSASDQYSLGIVAYTMLAGAPPFDAESFTDMALAHTGRAPDPVVELRPDCPEDLAKTVHRMLEKDPAARWESMGNVVNALGALPPRGDPTWGHAATLASGGTLATGEDAATWVTPVPRARPRSLAGTVSQWLKPKRRRYALGGAAVAAAAVLGFLGLPRADRASLRLSHASVTLAPGDTVPVLAHLLDVEGDTLAARVEWESDRLTVAAVTRDGRVVAVGEGTATVTARSGRARATLPVTVAAGPVARRPAADQPGGPAPDEADRPRDGAEPPRADANAIRFSLARTSLRLGDSLRPAVTLLDERDRAVGTTTAAALSAEDPSVLRVRDGGWVVAVGVGSTALRARTGELETRAAVSVTPVVPRLRSISAGADHTCGVGVDGLVYCWGENDRGQVADGVGRFQRFPFPRPGRFAAVAAGGLLTCALGQDQTVLCWGGLAAPPGRFRSIGAGSRHACGMTAGGAAACWGANDRGQLGIGAADRGGLGPVEGEIAFEMIAVGAEHTCGLLSGRIYCWGSDASGQTGSGSLDRGFVVQPREVAGDHGYFTYVAAGTYHTCALTRAGAAMCWGDNEYGQLGDGSTRPRYAPTPVRAPMRGAPRPLSFEMVSAGETHTCGITNTRRLFCWGDNRSGQLGDGTTTRRVVPERVKGGEGIVDVSTGRAHTCALAESGEARCWGANGAGQLGDGTAEDRLRPVVPGQSEGD